MKENSFSKEDTAFFKGVGISMIVIHNYLHLIPGFGLENEAIFRETNAIQFLKYFGSLDFKKIFGGLSGFLGHYGVQVFIFFSAYGLTIQFSKKNASSFKFVLSRLKKIYFLLGFGILFCVIYYTLIGSRPGVIGTIKKSFLLGSTLSSFSLDDLYRMFSGPFWFFALVIQFYIIFPLLYRFVTRFEKKRIYVPFLIVLGVTFILYFTLQEAKISLFGASFRFALFGNIFGHLPEVILGISMARFKFRNFNIITILAALVLYIFSQAYYFFFPFSFLSMTILLLVCINSFEKLSGTNLKTAILYIGKISMILFIVNGPLRHLSLFNVSPDLKWERFLLFLLIATVLSHILFLIYDKLRVKFKV